MTSPVSPSSPAATTPPQDSLLQNLFHEQQRLTRNDWLEVADQDEDNSFDAAFLEEFETAWSQFLLEQPEPPHKLLLVLNKNSQQQGQSIVELQKEADAVLQSKIKMENEMKKQIAFFHGEQEQVEKKFTKKIQETLEAQQQQRKLLLGKIEALDKAEEIHDETVPWFHFMKELDRLVVEKDVIAKDSTSRKVARPSARALLLAKCGVGTATSNHHNRHLRGDKLEWRASRIDQALMKAHSTMLRKEIERCETMLAINKEVGQFLNDLDIWSILKANDGASNSSGDSGTNKHRPHKQQQEKK